MWFMALSTSVRSLDRNFGADVSTCTPPTPDYVACNLVSGVGRRGDNPHLATSAIDRFGGLEEEDEKLTEKKISVLGSASDLSSI